MAASRKSAEGEGEAREQARKISVSADVEKTADGRYIIVDGRRWRATNPLIPEDERKRLVGELMKARRDVGRALREKDEEAMREARARVNQAKTALGERGAKWWEDGSGKER